MAVKPFSKGELNFFKFSSIILDEFPKAVRQIFVTLWDSKIAVLPGYQVWDDSTAVRNMLLKSEGGKTSIPINQSIGEWDCTALFQATIYAKTFGSLSGKGPTSTLNDLYLKKKKPATVPFHPSVNSPTGNQDETYALAIDQIRLLRNTLCHSAKSEIAKADFDQFVLLAKDALTAAKVSTTYVDGIGGLTENDFPTEKVTKLNESLLKELQANNQFLQGDMRDMMCEIRDLMKTSGEPTDTICKGSTPDSLPKSRIPLLVPHFTGRETECERISSLITSESKRLVNIWGSPGFGKTSTAIAVAHHLQSLGHPVFYSTFRGKSSKDELISELLSNFYSFSKSNAMSDLKPVHKLRSIFLEIPCRFFLVLDNLDDLLASKPNDSATSFVKDEVVDLIQEILVSCQNVSFLTTTRESLEYMRLKVVGYESLRIVPLDQLSSSKLIAKLLPSPLEDVVLDVIKIAGSVPLAIKLVCSLLSENIRTSREVLDDLTSSPNLLEILDNPDYPNDLRLKKLIDSSFDRLSPNEKEAFISLSVFLGADFNCDAAVAVIGGNKTFARRTLNILNRKSLIDQDSDSKIFSLHQLIQSFAFEKGKCDLQEVAFSSRTRFCNYYLFLFEDLNEQYLTGSSLRAYMTCLQEKENICLSLIESFSHEGLREKAFDVLAKAELLIQFTLRTNNDYQIDHVYELVIETAKKVKNDSALCKIVVSHFFRTTLLDEVSLIPEGLKKRIFLMRDGTGAKLLCYEGIRAICRGEMECGALLLTEGCSSLEKNPDQQILKCISLQLLSVYYAHSNNLDRSTQFSQMALDQCKEFGVARLFLIGEYETSTVKAGDETLGTALPSQPLIFEIIFLISVWARNILSDEMKHALSNTVCEMQREIQLQGSNELYSILEAGDAALSFLSTGQQTRLDETIRSIKTELEKEVAIMQGSDNANKSEKTMRQKLLEERLANCYRYKGYHHFIKNEQDLLLESLQRSLHVTLSLYGENHRDSAACYHDIGTLQHKMGEHTSALESLQHALDIWLKVYGEQHSHTAECYLEIGNTHFKMENYTLALEEQQHSLEIRLKLHGEQHLTTASSYSFIGKTQCCMGDCKLSLEFHERALQIRLNLHDEQHVTTASSFLNIGITQFFMKEYKEALNSNYRALKISLNLYGELHEFTGNCYRNTGIVWRAIGNKKLALQNVQRALNIRWKIFGGAHALTQESRNDVFLVINDMQDAPTAVYFFEQK